jgi:hypothetical protein
MNDREFIAEIGPWGFATAAVAMLGVFASRLATGIGVLESIGYALCVFLLLPFFWLFAGRYASYWFGRASHKRVVQFMFVVLWALLIVKLFFVGGPETVSAPALLIASLAAVFAGYAAARAFRRIAAGNIQAVGDEGMPGWLMHFLLLAALAVLLAV